MKIGEATKLSSFSDEGFGVGKIELPGNVVEIHVGGKWREKEERRDGRRRIGMEMRKKVEDKRRANGGRGKTFSGFSRAVAGDDCGEEFWRQPKIFFLDFAAESLLLYVFFFSFV